PSRRCPAPPHRSRHPRATAAFPVGAGWPRPTIGRPRAPRARRPTPPAAAPTADPLSRQESIMRLDAHDRRDHDDRLMIAAGLGGGGDQRSVAVAIRAETASTSGARPAVTGPPGSRM